MELKLRLKIKKKVVVKKHNNLSPFLVKNK